MVSQNTSYSRAHRCECRVLSDARSERSSVSAAATTLHRKLLSRALVLFLEEGAQTSCY